jgi:RimJ/RimL family protein N-acetyltransferase
VVSVIDEDTPVATTERLTLHWLTVDDAAFMLSLLNDPSFHEFIGDRGVRTLDDARQYLLSGAIASYGCNGFGLYLVREREFGTPVGICGLIHRTGLDDADLGFALLPAFWGRGLAVEAAEAVLHHARHDLGLLCVVAIVSPNNVRSIHVLERVGFRYERSVQLSGDADPVQLFRREL